MPNYLAASQIRLYGGIGASNESKAEIPEAPVGMAELL
jgi:hypothetical protein